MGSDRRIAAIRSALASAVRASVRYVPADRQRVRAKISFSRPIHRFASQQRHDPTPAMRRDSTAIAARPTGSVKLVRELLVRLIERERNRAPVICCHQHIFRIAPANAFLRGSPFNHLHGVIELLTAAAPFTDGDAAGLKVAGNFATTIHAFDPTTRKANLRRGGRI